MSQEQNSHQAPFDDVDLMQYVDGELDEATAQALDSHLEDPHGADSQLLLKVQSLEQMSDTVRSYLELEADVAEPRLDALWEVIDARLEDAPARAAAVSETRSQASADRKRTGLWARIVGLVEGYRGYILTGAVAAGAAAAIILAVRPPETERVVIERPVAMRPLPDQATPQPNDTTPDQPEIKLVTDEPTAPEPTAPEIEELEVSGGSGTVFIMPSEGEDDVSATVIFVDFDEAEGPIL